MNTKIKIAVATPGGEDRSRLSRMHLSPTRGTSVKSMRAALGALALAIPLAGLVPAGASVVPNAAIVRVAQCRAHGDYSICTAGGNVSRPVSLHVYVSAFPGQQVSGAWDVVCSKGTGAGSRSGTFSGRATGRYPLKRQLGMPYAYPDSCTVAADAQLSGTGDLIHVWIMAQRR